MCVSGRVHTQYGGKGEKRRVAERVNKCEMEHEVLLLGCIIFHGSGRSN
jgi:hypothetical protein